MLLRSRALSLVRRSQSLPGEIDQWLRYAEAGKQFEKNASQLDALDVFMTELLDQLQSASAELLNLAQASAPDTNSLMSQAQTVELGIWKTQRVWGYFRGKLEQRFTPQLALPLLAMDLIAHDCYQTVINSAKTLRIINQPELRDYPLTYLTHDEFSPLTWQRSTPLPGLQHRALPVPVIGIPLDHLAVPWGLLALHHEAGHDLDADLNGPAAELGNLVRQRLLDTGAPVERSNAWRGWMEEIFADFVAVMLAGPAFVSFLAGFLAWSPANVYACNPGDPHPVIYLRTLLNLEFALNLIAGQTAHQYLQEIADEWRATYDNPPNQLALFRNDFAAVIDAFRASPLASLRDNTGQPHTISELMHFSTSELQIQLQLSNCFLNGLELLESLPLRHILGAAYMAVEEKISLDGCLDEEFASNLAAQVYETIIVKAPPGQLPLRNERSRRYLRQLAKAYFEAEVN
jgi:hypothetical protein